MKFPKGKQPKALSEDVPRSTRSKVVGVLILIALIVAAIVLLSEWINGGRLR